MQIVSRRWRWRHYLDRTVRVHTPTSTLEGVLVGVYRDYYALRDPRFIAGTDREYDLGGSSVLVPEARVDFLQVL